MGKFTIVVEGSVIGDLLVLEMTTTNACTTSHTFSINATSGDSITLNFTYTGSGTYRPGLNGVGIADGHTFTSSGTDALVVYLPETAVVETVDIDVEAVNNTTVDSQTINVTRESGGAPCA